MSAAALSVDTVLSVQFKAADKDEIDFQSFVNNVLGSTKKSGTSLDSCALRSHSKITDRISDRDGNSDKFLRRKIREHWKDLRFAFRHADLAGTGIITPQTLRDVLEGYDIIMADSQFTSLLAKMDKDGVGEVSYDEFFAFFQPGQADEKLDSIVGVISSKMLSLPKAKELIREKMRGRLAGGPAELRRTFQYFDGDGSGQIDVEEFKEGLKLHCGLRFEQKRIDQLMADYSGKKGHITFTDFVENVLDSKTSDSTGLGHYKTSSKEVANDEGNSDQFIRRKVRESWKDIIIAFKHACNGDGTLSPATLRRVLFRFNIIMTDGAKPAHSPCAASFFPGVILSATYRVIVGLFRPVRGHCQEDGRRRRRRVELWGVPQVIRQGHH